MITRMDTYMILACTVGGTTGDGGPLFRCASPAR